MKPESVVRTRGCIGRNRRVVRCGEMIEPPKCYITIYLHSRRDSYITISWKSSSAGTIGTSNTRHATRHGCGVDEIESVVRNAGRGGSRKIGKGKYTAEGRGQGRRMIRVIFVLDDDATRFVIHAMPLTTRGRRRGR
jgi:hypothetical protein